uniref:Uncharacterized protein n=1 Tax=viral metagenome TaxID=1070528 RepID=A0A6M3K0B8_9ZZZZ
MGNKFGWHSGVLTCKDAKIQGDLYVQDDIVFSDVSAGVLGVTGGIDMQSTVSAIGIDLGGTFSTTAINIDGTVAKAIKMGSYSARLTAASGATTEVCTIGLGGAEDDFYIGYGSYIRTTGEDGKGFGASFLVEATNTTGTPTLQGMQSMAFLGSVGGSEAAILKTRGGDTTAGMTAGWFKIGCNTNCSLASGSYSSVIWLDSQLHGSGNLSGTHYHIFCSTDNIQTSVLGFNGTGGYTNFIHTDSDANKTPFDGGSVATNTGASDGSIKISLNGTSYLIPYFTA